MGTGNKHFIALRARKMAVSAPSNVAQGEIAWRPRWPGEAGRTLGVRGERRCLSQCESRGMPLVSATFRNSVAGSRQAPSASWPTIER